jgi:hypothetical protein
MLVSSFVVSVVQAIITVFLKDLENPFNDWSDSGYRQGFSWRPGSVSFRLPEDYDVARVHVDVFLERDAKVRPDAIRAISVPFSVPISKVIDVSGIYEKVDRSVQVPAGEYALLFQIGPFLERSEVHVKDELPTLWCELTFIDRVAARPDILKCDPELDPPDPLVLDGKPA